jgi:hypothetical protein
MGVTTRETYMTPWTLEVRRSEFMKAGAFIGRLAGAA